MARPSLDIPDAVAAVIAQRMRELGMSPRGVAHEASRLSGATVGESTVRHIVNRTRSTFSEASLWAVSRALGWEPLTIHKMAAGYTETPIEADTPLAADRLQSMIEDHGKIEVLTADGADIIDDDPDMDDVMRKVDEALNALEAFKRAQQRKR